MWICSKVGFFCLSNYDGPYRLHAGPHWQIESPVHQDLVNLLSALDMGPGFINHRPHATLRFAVVIAEHSTIERLLGFIVSTVDYPSLMVAMEEDSNQEDKIEAYANLKEDLLLKADGWAKLYLKAHKPRCQWHQSEDPVDYDGEQPNGVGCPDCHRMLDTRNCDGCGEDFIDYSAQGYDDIITAARVTSAGDLTCVVCLDRHEQADETEVWYE